MKPNTTNAQSVKPPRRNSLISPNPDAQGISIGNTPKYQEASSQPRSLLNTRVLRWSPLAALTPRVPPARNLGIALQREQTPCVSAHRSRMLGRLTLATPAAMPAPGLEQRRTRAADRYKLATIVRHDRGLALDKWRRTVWSRAGEQSSMITRLYHGVYIMTNYAKLTHLG